MDLRKTGLIFGIFGILLLFIAVIIGIIIGNNEQTQREIWNDYSTYDDRPKRAEDAEESNAFLINFNTGLCSFGIGLILIGIGFSLVKDARKNLSVLFTGGIAFLILFTSLIISIYEGTISREEIEIHNKDEETEKDIDREDEIEETQAFLGPFNQFFGGFLLGSLGIGLALFTIVLSVFRVNKSKKEPKLDKFTYFSVEPLIEDEDIEEEEKYAEILED